MRPNDTAIPASKPPQVSPLLFSGFVRYGRRLTARHFHAVRLLKNARPDIPADRPLIVYLNHPSWWDPMIGLVLATSLFANRKHYAVIDEAMLEKYRVFKKLGFVGIPQNPREGAARFLRAGSAILAQSDAALWVTAQGQFTDTRVRPVVLRPGIAHLARRNPQAALLPLAIDITFWNERQPEALTAFGELFAPPQGATPKELTPLLETRLAAALDSLSVAAISRDESRFDVVLQKAASVTNAYDAARWLRAMLTGQKFDPTHSGRKFEVTSRGAPAPGSVPS